MKPVLLYLLLLSIPMTSLGAESDVSTDAASKPVPTVTELSAPSSPPRINGSIESYLFLSQRSQMRQLEPGAYERQDLNVLPFYEILTLRADQLGNTGLSVHLQAIAGLDLADVYLDNRFVADPVIAYVQFQKKYIDARLGRQLIFAGAAEGLHIDGLRVSLLTPLHIGVEGFGGLLVSPRQGPDWYRGETATDFDEFGRGLSDWRREGNFGIGGRLFLRLGDKANAGVSLLQLTDHREVSSRLLGVDLDMAPTSWMSISGKSSIDMATLSFRDAGGYLDFIPSEKVRFGAHYKHVDPTLYINSTSIFSVFSNEKHNAIGASLALTPSRRLSMSAAYSQLWYQFLEPTDSGWGQTYHLGQQIDVDTIFKYGPLGNFGTLRAGYGRIARELSAVNQIRLGALIPFGDSGVKSSLNAYVDLYQEPILDQQVSVLGDVGFFYYTGRIRTGASFRAGQTPYSNTELSGMITFAYNFVKTFSNQE